MVFLKILFPNFDPTCVYIYIMQVSGEFPLGSHGHGEQMFSSSLHKRVHPYPVSEHGLKTNPLFSLPFAN